MTTLRLSPALVLLSALTACGGGDTKDAKKTEAKTEARAEVADSKADAKVRPRARATDEARMPAPKGRVVALGGLDGNLAATKAALKAAGAIDDAGNWTGGDLVVVQLGNQLGPGKDEQAVLRLLDTLAGQASQAGGALYRLAGANEILNVALTFDGVSAQGFKDYAGEKVNAEDPRIDGLPKPQRGRATAFAAGGSMAKKLAEQKLVLIVGDTVFAHAGVLEDHVKYGLDIINTEGKKWMLAQEAMMPNMLSDLGPARTPKLRGPQPFCGGVEQVLGDLAAKRMVITRGPEKSEATMCDGLLLRAGPVAGDASGGPEIVEIAGDAAKFVPVAGGK
ncbi:MAG TPA: hypothetical protein VGB85_03155 [Nannocystis sp.]|jgi:hypothetical protein